MRRVALSMLLALLAVGALAGPAGAAETWRSQQPPGANGSYPLLGEVGDVECWAANRCVLIAGGNGGVAAGIFAYDGDRWYRYSTVCGGEQGRVAWAGPTEFWTVSTQQAGQATGEEPPPAISLCHFKDGQVVASYGEPVGVASSYMQMYGAACNGPSDCWFGGARLPGTPNVGAFHLHWDGATVTPTPSLTTVSELSDPGRRVADIAYHDGSFYEAVDVEEGDQPNPEEEVARDEFGLGPSLVHRLSPGTSTPFKPLIGAEPLDLGEGSPTDLGGTLLAGAEGEDLWAVAGSTGEPTPVVLRLGKSGPAQLALSDPGAVLAQSVEVRAAAADPGADRVWVALRRFGDGNETLLSPARLTSVAADGTVAPEVTLPLPGDESDGEPVGNKGVASALACPGPEQCWLATRKGWLFHLGPNPAPNADPVMHTLITSRPADNSLPSLPPLELPQDDSGLEEGGNEQGPEIGEEPLPPKVIPPLVRKIKFRMVTDTLLEMSFTLREKARVQLLGYRAGAKVAKTPKRVLAKGRRSLRLELDPKAWPTRFDLEAKATKKKKKGSK